jgi:DNA-binding GntR family transcriptional regulator
MVVWGCDNMNLEYVERISTESTREYVYSVLKHNIINMHLVPGQNISEKEMAEVLNVSRTPVREAFIKLTQEELLDIYPQKGTYISMIDLGHVEESRFMRASLEKAVIGLACKEFPPENLFELQLNINAQELCISENNHDKLFKLDEDMHGLFFAGCRKKRVWMAIQQMSTHFNRVRILNLATSFHWDSIVTEHRQLIEAVKNHNSNTAVSVIEKHLTRVIYDQEELKVQYPDYFK